MRFDKEKVRRGMTAISTKGERLGKVIQCDDTTFVIEKGVFFHKDYQLYYDYVTEARGDELVYALEDSRLAGRDAAVGAEYRVKEGNVESIGATRKEGLAGAVTGAAAAIGAKASDAKAKVAAKLPERSGIGEKLAAPLRSEEKAATPWRAGETVAKPLRAEETAPAPSIGEPLLASRPAADTRTGVRAFGEESEMRIPLMEEQLAVEKVEREAGHVRIHKEVKVEEKHVTVPVRREEVTVERLPGRESSLATAGMEPFKEQTVDLPVHEEDLRVTKQTVVREELRVRRTSHEEQREAAATLRHEEAKIEDTTLAGGRSGREEAAGLSAAGSDEESLKKA